MNDTAAQPNKQYLEGTQRVRTHAKLLYPNLNPNLDISTPKAVK